MGNCLAPRSLSSPRATNHRGRLFSQVSLSYRSPFHKNVPAKRHKYRETGRGDWLKSTCTHHSVEYGVELHNPAGSPRPQARKQVMGHFDLSWADPGKEHRAAIAGALVFDSFIHLRLSLTSIPFSHEVYRESLLYERGSDPLDRILLPR
jgi:hypothetical protein